MEVKTDYQHKFQIHGMYSLAVMMAISTGTTDKNVDNIWFQFF